jgi:hypothetical protein
MTMKLHPLLLGTLIALALSACNENPAPGTPPAPAAPAAAETQAFYGDEAPIAVPAQAADIHDHSHEGDAGHVHGDEHGHSHGDAAHRHDPGARDTDHDHDHGDGTAPHDH